ncbi:hypothetical protein C8R45DRAFT_1033552 [Mycena sanguinolenta]|nr:hypothetical protein C8R45DRAFT_1041182 [Mycena sanguinolenta]KAJ6457380.1 hypothetical protein C8R45DRAFT_1033552 [Mycena sanguinolenta]
MRTRRTVYLRSASCTRCSLATVSVGGFWMPARRCSFTTSANAVCSWALSFISTTMLASAPNEPPFAHGGRRRLRLPTTAHTAAAATSAASAVAQAQPVPQRQRRQDVCLASVPPVASCQCACHRVCGAQAHGKPAATASLASQRHLSLSSFSFNCGQRYGRGGGVNHCTRQKIARAGCRIARRATARLCRSRRRICREKGDVLVRTLNSLFCNACTRRKCAAASETCSMRAPGMHALL